MSINISSDEDECAGELPHIDIKTITKKPSRTIKNDVIENIDLTRNVILKDVKSIRGSCGSGSSLSSIVDNKESKRGKGKLQSNQADKGYGDELVKTMVKVELATSFQTNIIKEPAEIIVSGLSKAFGSESSSIGSSGYESGSSGAKRKKTKGDEPNTKTETASEQVNKKQKLASERAEKVAAAETLKMYKSSECMKYMNIEVHPALRSAWYMSDLPRELQGAGGGVLAEPHLFDKGLIVWSRRVQRKLTGLDGLLQLSEVKEPCERCVLVLEAEQAAQLVLSRSLATHVVTVRAAAAARLTLILFGVKDYFKSASKKKAKSMTEIELEMAITDLLVTADCDTVMVNTPNELALLLVQFTKAIAESPLKQAKRALDEQAEFYMRGDNKKCVAVLKNGSGLSRLWQQMVAILPASSLEISRAVCANYKSPLALYEALQDTNGVNELADIGVDRAGLPGTRHRRLGPEFSRKLKTLFTANDGEMLLD